MTVSIEQAQKSLAELIDQLSPGAGIVITRNKQPVAQLVSVSPTQSAAEFGSCQGMLTVMAEDDEHLKDFEDYMP